MATDQERLKRNLRATEAQVTAFLARLDKFLSTHLEDIAARISADDQIDSAVILGSIQEELIAAGLDREIGRLQAIYADELSVIAGEFTRLGAQRAFADVDLDIIEKLITFDIERVTGTVRNYVDDVRSVLMRNVISGETPDFRPLKETLGTRLVSSLDTEVNTSLMAFNRSVTTSKAKELGFELFIYLGPDDDITREFCQNVLEEGPIYSLEEINAMDNEQGLPVLEYGGGYNCRHQWRPISEEKARAQGWQP